MVFVNVPTTIENANHVREAEAAHAEALENNNDIQASAAIRVLQTHQFVATDAVVRKEIGDALARINTARTNRDANVKALTDRVKTNADALSSFNKRYTDAPAGAPGDAARATVVTDMRNAIEASRAEVARLAGLVPADRPHNIDAQIAESRQQITRLNTATFLTDAQRTELQRSDLSRLDPAATAAGAGRDLLGQGLLQRIEGLPSVGGETTLNRDGVNVKFKYDAAAGWQVQRLAVVAGVAVDAAYTPVVAGVRYDLTHADFAGAPNAAKRAAAEQYNAIVDGLVGLNGGSRDQVIKRETARAENEVVVSNAANNTFFITTLPPLETELTAARTTPGNTVRLEAATKAVRDAFAARKTAILARMKAVSDTEPRPLPNLASHLEELQKHMTQTQENERRLLPPTTVTAPPVTPDTLPAVERPAVEAFNKFLNENAAVNGLTDAETTRKPAIDAILAQLPTLTTEGQRTQGRNALIAKLNAKGYTLTTLEFSPARLEIRRTADTTPATPEVTTFLGSDAERTTLKNALSANVGNLDVPAVRDAIAVFQKRLSAVPVAQRNDAVNRLIAATRTPATATADGAEVAAVADGDSFRLEPRKINRTPATPPPAAESKERRDRMNDFIKVIIELIKALIQIENRRMDMQQRNFERLMQELAKSRAQRDQFAPRRNETPSPQYVKMQAQVTRLEGEIAQMRKERAEQIAKANAVITRAPNNMLVLEGDADLRRPVRVCVRPGVRLADAGVATRVSADIDFLRRDGRVSLVATSSPTAPAPTPAVPTTAFNIGSVTIDNRATTNATIINSPNASISGISTTATVTPPPPRISVAGAPPPPPRIAGSGPAREGSLNG